MLRIQAMHIAIAEVIANEEDDVRRGCKKRRSKDNESDEG
jgi:hypothetical protein